MTAALAALLFALWSIIAVAPAANAQSTTCNLRVRYQTDHFNDGTIGADEWWITARHTYLYCTVTPGQDFVVVKKSTYIYNFEGSSQNCTVGAGFNRMDYITFNSYFWDEQGRNVNPPPITLDCSHTSTRSTTVAYNAIVRLYSVDGLPPKWRTRYDLVRKSPTGTSDHYGSLFGKFRHCSGIGANICR